MPIGPLELGIILVIIIIIFGVGKLPEIGGALGRGISEFRESSREPHDDSEGNTHSTDVEASTTKPNNEPAKEEL